MEEITFKTALNNREKTVDSNKKRYMVTVKQGYDDIKLEFDSIYKACLMISDLEPFCKGETQFIVDEIKEDVNEDGNV